MRSGGRVERVVCAGGDQCRRGRLPAQPTEAALPGQSPPALRHRDETVDRQRTAWTAHQRHSARLHRVPRSSSAGSH